MTDNAIAFSLSSVAEELRRGIDRYRSAGELLANASWWMDTRVRGAHVRNDSPWSTVTAITLDRDRLLEAPYLAALGYLNELGTEVQDEGITRSLRKVIRRSPHTAERTAWADDPLTLAGLWLLAKRSAPNVESQIITEVFTTVTNASAVVVAILGLIDEGAVSHVRPFSLLETSDSVIAACLHVGQPSLAELLYPKTTYVDSMEKVVADACSGQLGRLHGMERSLALIALQAAIRDAARRVSTQQQSSLLSLQKERSVSVNEHRCDVGILTIKDEEFEAVLDMFTNEPELYEGPKSKRHYNLRTAESGKSTSYRVAIVRHIEQGTGDAQTTARDMIEELAPGLILVVGIAGGRPTVDFTLGDVILSLRVHDYTVHASSPGKEDTYAMGGGPIVSEIQKGVANLKARRADLGDWSAGLPSRPPVDLGSLRLKGPMDWQGEVRTSIQYHFQDSPRSVPLFKAGSLGSSDGLIKDPEILIAWLRTARDLLAIEMEAAGVYRAARDRCAMLAIRAISDIVGLERDERWTQYAACSAAAFARAYLRTSPIPPTGATKPPRAVSRFEQNKSSMTSKQRYTVGANVDPIVWYLQAVPTPTPDSTKSELHRALVESTVTSDGGTGRVTRWPAVLRPQWAEIETRPDGTSVWRYVSQHGADNIFDEEQLGLAADKKVWFQRAYFWDAPEIHVDFGQIALDVAIFLKLLVGMAKRLGIASYNVSLAFDLPRADLRAVFLSNGITATQVNRTARATKRSIDASVRFLTSNANDATLTNAAKRLLDGVANEFQHEADAFFRSNSGHALLEVDLDSISRLFAKLS